jgi:hypothetical protein
MSVIDNALFAADFLAHKDYQQGRIFTLRKRRALERQARYQSQNPPDIPILDAGATPAQFKKATRNYRNPAIVRGLMRDVAAVRQWPDRRYLSDLCGDSLYRMVGNGHEDDIVGGNIEFTEGTVRDLMDGLARGNDFRYLAGVSQIFIDHPQIVQDLDLEKLHAILGPNGLKKRFDALNMFIGTRGTRSRIHCAFAGNFFVNVVGRKRWRLLPPHFKHFLLPIASRPFIYAITYFDPLANDAERGDFVKRLPFFEVVLEPGDLLYNGPWWWHQVENLEPLNIGCAVRIGQFRADVRNNTTFTFLSVQPQVYILRMFYLLERALKRHDEDFRTYVLRFLHHQQLQRTLKLASRDG